MFTHADSGPASKEDISNPSQHLHALDFITIMKRAANAPLGHGALWLLVLDGGAARRGAARRGAARCGGKSNALCGDAGL